jgi:hypothetical protein
MVFNCSEAGLLLQRAATQIATTCFTWAAPALPPSDKPEAKKPTKAVDAMIAPLLTSPELKQRPPPDAGKCVCLECETYGKDERRYSRRQVGQGVGRALQPATS